MIKNTILFVFLALSINALSQVQNYNVGDVVDDFTVTDTDGNEHNLYSITAEGKYVFLDFFFDTCGPCQQTTPIFNELHDKYGCNEGEVYCLSINNGTDSDAEVIAFEETYGGPFEHAPAVSADGGAGAVDNNFGIYAYPTYCLINPDNEIINLDIWPISNVGTFEAAFPVDFNPTPMECTPLSIEDLNHDITLKIYPNPSDGSSINILLPVKIQTADINVYNVIGELVFSNQFDYNEILIQTNLSSGTYIIHVATEMGSVHRSLIIK
jgi:thiol-disulfide isomerase/thioredoxin